MANREDAKTARAAIAAATSLGPGERKCQAHTSSGRPCSKWAIKGGRVCQTHGGGAPQVKRKAAERLLAEVDPTISRLIELRDQSDHLPTAMMASKEIMNRTLGAADKTADSGSKGPQITIGFLQAPGQPAMAAVAQVALPEAVDADVEDDDDRG